MAELDIIIPVYNEGPNIAATLRALAAGVKARTRVLICYDFAEDNTLPAIEANRSQYAHLDIVLVKNSGRGAHAAVMVGFAASTAPYVLVYPADDDYNAGIVDSMLERAKAGADVVCASRFMHGGSMRGASFLKNILVRVGNWVSYHLALVPTHDASNGFRLFSRRVITDIPIESSVGFTYSIELLVKAHRSGWRIDEIPAQWIERRAGSSRFRLIHWLSAYLRWLWYGFVTTYLYRYRALVVACVVVLACATVPVFQASFALGDMWQGVPPVYMDEYIYYSHVTETGTGNLFMGNPYILEHRNNAPLVLFGSNILAALPLLFGVPLYTAIVFNLMLWGLVFVVLYYALVRQFGLPQWLSASVAFFAYLQSCDQIYRISVRQEVFPFLLFFWIALARFLYTPTTRTVLWLGAAAGATFYIYGFLWQTVVVTLGLVFLYALVRRDWIFVRQTLYASMLGGLIGLPAFGYTLWVTGHQYFWESTDRFGLVNTHLPVAELVWSGGWAFLGAALMALFAWRIPALRRQWHAVVVFVVVTGLALWIMQGSNALTGKLWEIGDHMRRFIIVWLPIGTVLLATVWYHYRGNMGVLLRYTAGVAIVLIACSAVYFGWHHSHPFREHAGLYETWREQQLYAAPMRWLEEHESKPVVVWGDTTLFSTIHVPVLTKHYVLYTEAANYMLWPTDEVRERYLVSRYFDGATVEELKSERSMLIHAGRANTYHLPKTLERKELICRMLLWIGAVSECAQTPTSQEVMGEEYFYTLSDKFESEIRPNILQYLGKYNVSYILKDTAHNSNWRPEELGAERVYADERFELHKI